jgi:hypothetical protein
MSVMPSVRPLGLIYENKFLFFTFVPGTIIASIDFRRLNYLLGRISCLTTTEVM